MNNNKISLIQLKKHLFSESTNDIDELDSEDVASIIINNLTKMFSDISFSKQRETEDYIEITVNSERPDKSRKELSSFRFSNATGFIVEPLRHTIRNGYQLQVFDEHGDTFDKDVFIRIRKGGIYNAGVRNEQDFISVIQSSLDSGQDCIMFKASGGSLTNDSALALKDAVSVRDCSKDAGSRTGNRADIEITTKDNKHHRISLKKDTAFKVAGVVKKFANESFRIGKIIRRYFNENNLPIDQNRYISVKITNEDLYRWCWFGNDIDKNGAVIICNASAIKPEEHEDCTLIPVLDIINPNTSTLELIDTYPIYLLMRMSRSGHVEVLYAVLPNFGRRYLFDDLVIPGVND